MTAAFRYVKNTVAPDAATIPIGSTGKDSQLIAFDITCTSGILVGANANILQWTGAGKIQSIISCEIFTNTGGIYSANNILTLVTIDATGKIINVNVQAAGTAITANNVIKLLLVIGNY